MRIRLQFFGLAEEAAGVSHALLELPERATVADAVQAARRAIPALERTGGARIRYAVNTEYAADSASLRDGDTVSFIPPVGGG